MLPHVEPGADVLEIPRAVELDDLVRVADAGIEVGDLPPVARLEAALLDQLALRGGERRLAALDLARGQLDEVAAGGIAGIALEEDRSGGDGGEGHHRAGGHAVLVA